MGTLISAVKSPMLGLKEILLSVLLTALDCFLQGEFFRSLTSTLFMREILTLMVKCTALKIMMMVLEPSELVLTLVLQEPLLVQRFLLPSRVLLMEVLTYLTLKRDSLDMTMRASH